MIYKATIYYALNILVLLGLSSFTIFSYFEGLLYTDVLIGVSAGYFLAFLFGAININKALKPLDNITKALRTKEHDLKTNLDNYDTSVSKETPEVLKIINEIVLEVLENRKEVQHQIETKNSEINEMNNRLKVSEEAAIKVMNEIQEIDRMKTEFISLASHQLRTPLVSVKWGLEMLLNEDLGKLDGLNPQQLQYVKNTHEASKRLLQLVNDLLNVSRIESGRLIIDPKLHDLEKIINEVVKDVNPRAHEKIQDININVQENVPEIMVDLGLIRHVYLNLLTNAIKYSPDHTEINVEVYKNGDQVISKIEDSGYGIPEKDQDKLFHKFHRASNAPKHDTKGTGLGLYLVKAIIEASGGTIWFESTQDKGTTFWFSLPIEGMQKREGEVSII